MQLAYLVAQIDLKIGIDNFLKYSSISQEILCTMTEKEIAWSTNGAVLPSIKELAEYHRFCADVANAFILLSNAFKSIGFNPNP